MKQPAKLTIDVKQRGENNKEKNNNSCITKKNTDFYTENETKLTKKGTTSCALASIITPGFLAAVFNGGFENIPDAEVTI